MLATRTRGHPSRPACGGHLRACESFVRLCGEYSPRLVERDSLRSLIRGEGLMAGDDKLFGELPEQARPQASAEPAGAPRLREPKRDQVELRAVDADGLIGQDHPVRVI